MSGRVLYISRLEHALIITFAGLMVALIVGQFIFDHIDNYNWAVAYEQKLLYRQATGNDVIIFGSPGYPVDGFHLISVLLFVALAIGRKFYFALVFTLTYLATLSYVIHLRIVNAGLIDPSTAPFARYAEIAGNWILAEPFFLLPLVFLVPLLLWEVFIISRVLRKTLKFPKLT